MNVALELLRRLAAEPLPCTIDQPEEIVLLRDLRAAGLVQANVPRPLTVGGRPFQLPATAQVVPQWLGGLARSQPADAARAPRDDSLRAAGLARAAAPAAVDLAREAAVPDFPIIVIGGGEGSVDAARRLLKSLPSDLPAGVLLHLTPAATEKAPDLLPVFRPHCSLPLQMATHGQIVQRSCVRIVPPGHAAAFDSAGALQVSRAEAAILRPIDALFRSAAAAYGRKLVGVVLSGAGDDGTAGLRVIKAAGGTSIVQSPSDSANAGMPVHALLGDQPDHSALVQQIGPLLVRVAHRLAG